MLGCLACYLQMKLQCSELNTATYKTKPLRFAFAYIVTYAVKCLDSVYENGYLYSCVHLHLKTTHVDCEERQPMLNKFS